MNYVDSFIAVAEDCPVRAAVAPRVKGDKKSVAVIQYELLAGAPYVYTQEDVLFQTHARHKDIPAEELEARGGTLREEFFARLQDCLRASPLVRRYGWGLHFDREGKVALLPMKSSAYGTLAGGEQGGPAVLKAFRSSRA